MVDLTSPQSNNLFLMGMLSWLEVHTSWGTSLYRPCFEIAASVHAQGCLAREQPAAAKGQSGRTLFSWFFIGCFAGLLLKA